ncbi:hypothetical protein GYB22_00470 [bacterium]|nr:hypothetical protein [bacterium]
MKKFPWHSILIVLYAVVFLYAENIALVRIKDVLPPLGVVFGGLIVLFGLVYLFFRNIIQAGIFTTIVAFLFFSYGHYYELFYPEKIPLTGIRLDQNFYKWSSLLILLFLIWRFKFKKVVPLKTHKLFNFISILLLCMPLYTIFEYSTRDTSDIIGKKQIEQDKEQLNTPSIYYLIADAYGRADVLKDIYNFDNGDFINYLEDKGFYVADKSFASYGQTILSVTSTLNMMYLDSFAKKVGLENDDRWPLKTLIDDSKVINKLKAQGYTSIAFDAAMFTAVFLDSADHFFHTPDAYVNLFQNELVNSTAIRAFHREPIISTKDAYGHHRKKILNAFERIKDISKTPGKFYVHGHVLAPHQPFVFDAEGNAVQPNHSYTIWRPIEKGRDPEKYKKEYIEQLKFVNKKLKETIDAILAQSEEPPIIILQGDHGPCSELLNTQGFEDNNFGERMPILNAYYFPDGDYSMLNDSISPVNSYRVIMNKYFKMDLPLLKDQSFYSSWNYPYKFYNVTDSLN